MRYYMQEKKDRLGYKINRKIVCSITTTLEYMGECVGSIVYFICDLLGLRVD